jgi:hypothetical protein
MFEIKTTSNGSRPQNVKRGISHQSEMLAMKMTSNGRQPPKEDNLKILNVEYLRNHWLDLPKKLSLSSGDQTKSKNA